MSNLSELLPSGGGQNLVEFVASGTLPNGKPVILNSDGTVTVVAESTVSGGDAITAGTPVVFESATSADISVAMLTSTKAIVTYRDSNNSNYGTSCILDVSGSTITAGTTVVFESTGATYTAVAMLTSTKAIVTYYDIGNSGYSTACILDVSGSTITAGTPVVFEALSSNYISVASLTSTKAIVTYRPANSIYGTSCRILDISGSTITAGTAVVFNSASSSYLSVSSLTSTKAIVVYRDNGNSRYGTACILDVSGSSITAGTPVVFESAHSTYTAVASLTSTKAIVVYTDNGNTYYGTSCILDVSGSTITSGTAVVFEAASSSYISVASLTSTKAIVTYQDGGNSSYGTSCILDVSGSSITAGTPVVFEAASSSYISVAMLTSTKAIVTYQDAGNSSYGTSSILDNSVTTTNLTSTNLIGITSEATSSGGTAKINTWGGINEAQTSLVIASDYYAQTDGTLSTVSTSPAQKVGTAISATTINMKDLT